MNRIAINEAIERKKPITRASIDEQVSVLKAELEDCVKRLAFDECGPLQDKLEELTLKQADLPTINELRAAVTNAENAMANAARNRDFAGAAVAQSDVEKAKQRLLDNLAADDDEAARAKEEHHKGILSRSDLETRIADIVAKLDAMTIANDLSTVTTWRVKLQEYEGLRNEFPTIEELRQEIFARKVDVEEAVSKKAFSKAGELNDKLAGLENKLAQELLDSGSENYCSLTFKSSIITESGENVTFSSRFDLEQQVESTTLLIAKLVGERDFKKAAAVQANLDELFNQRKHFLSVEELQLQLQSNTIELQSAIANMRFADADRLQCNQIEIERKIAFERTSVPIPLLTAQNGSTDHSENVNITSGLTATNEDNNSSVQPTLFIDQPYSKDINLARTTTIPIAKINSASVKSLPLKSAAASDVSSHIELTTSLQPVINVAKLPPEIQRTVAKLRPATPLIGLCADTVLSVAQRLTDNRCSACIIVGKSGGLAGIITDTDITRRIVAKRIDPATATASSAMTPSPRCVATTDSALDALTTMVENHFRHLPVVDEGGNVVGILDIAKCLNDAITKLERNHEKSNSSAEQVVKQVMSQQMTSGAQAASLVALLSNLMAQAFGGLSTPTLRSLITGKPNTIVSPEASISKAGLVMAESRKAALVVKDNELVGVFTFKDMMSRVVAKGLNLDQTVVSKVMTPCPESITPDKTVLEALQIMHDQRILTLPVCEKNGEVVGLVDVMDVIHGCGGAEGWKSIFNSAIGLQDDQSDIRSISVSSKAATREIPHEQLISGSETTRVRPMSVHDKSVAKLRPMQPCIASTGDSILSVVQLLKRKRSSASFIVNSEGSLVGIVTDTDITRRVVAKYIDVNASAVSSVMTTNPTVVEMSAPATDALMTMVENHFRHLPVVDEEGSVVGLLDVAKCLDDAITKLEKSTETKSLSAEDVVKQAIRDHGGEASQTTAMLALLGTLLSKTMGDRKLPSLRSLLAGKPSSIVSPDSSIRDAGIVMAESRKAALIVKNGELVGIFSFKDCMNRAVAAELPLEQTPVSEVMTQNPEFASPDITVLEALQIMRDQRFLTLPVCEQNGTVVGVVDVMDIIYGCGGADGWKSIFNTALDIDDNSAVTSGITKQRSVAVGSRASNAIKGPVVARIMPNIPPNIPATLEFDDDGDNSFAGSTIGDERGVSKLLSPEDRSGSGAIGFVVFKVSCPSGSTHRIRCEATVQDLVSAITSKISNPLENMRIEYEDDEGDTVVVSSDDDVAEAFNLARKAGKKLAKLTVVEGQKPPKSFTTVWVGGGLAAVALLGAVAFALLRPKK